MKEAEPLMFSAQFCTHFKAFVDNITADCKELRNISNSAAEVNTYDEEFSEDMIEELQDKIDHLERQTTTLCSYPGLRLPLSLEYLLSLSRSLVSQNATALDSLVHALNQYGYTHSTALTSHEKVNEMKTMNIAASNTDVNVSKTPLISKVSKIPKCEEDEEDGGTPRLEDIGLSELSLQLLNNNINSNAALPSKQLQFAAIESSSDEEDDDCITEESIYKRHGVSPPSTPLNQVKSLPYYTHSTPLSLNMNHITASSSHTPAAATPLTQSTVTPKITATPLISSTPVTSVTSVTSATLSAKSASVTAAAAQETAGIRKITPEEMKQLPTYLLSQISFENLNQIISQINSLLQTKRLKAEEAILKEEELKDNSLFAQLIGNKSRAVLLMLIQLNRIQSLRKDGQTVFKVVN